MTSSFHKFDYYFNVFLRLMFNVITSYWNVMIFIVSFCKVLWILITMAFFFPLPKKYFLNDDGHQFEGRVMISLNIPCLYSKLYRWSKNRNVEFMFHNWQLRLIRKQGQCIKQNQKIIVPHWTSITWFESTFSKLLVKW